MTRRTLVDRDRAQPFLSSEDHWSSYSPARVLLLLIAPVQILLNTLLQGSKYYDALLKNLPVVPASA